MTNFFYLTSNINFKSNSHFSGLPRFLMTASFYLLLFISKLSIHKNILILLLLFSHFMHICLQIWAAWCFGHRSHCRQATKLSDSLDHNTWLEDNACLPHGLHRPLHHLSIVLKIEFDCTSLPESNKAIHVC